MRVASLSSAAASERLLVNLFLRRGELRSGRDSIVVSLRQFIDVLRDLREDDPEASERGVVSALGLREDDRRLRESGVPRDRHVHRDAQVFEALVDGAGGGREPQQRLGKLRQPDAGRLLDVYSAGALSALPVTLPRVAGRLDALLQRRECLLFLGRVLDRVLKELEAADTQANPAAVFAAPTSAVLMPRSVSARSPRVSARIRTYASAIGRL